VPAVLVAMLGAALVPFVPVTGWGGILALVFAQQLLVFVRALLRVSAAAAEVHYGGARRAGTPAASSPPPAWPAEEGPPVHPPFLGQGL
jgi:hypothetical protein